jgi:hypothetical protein
MLNPKKNMNGVKQILLPNSTHSIHLIQMNGIDKFNLFSFIKIQLNGVFWFEDDLCLVNNSNTLWTNVTDDKKGGIRKHRSVINEQQNVNNNNNVLKKHIENTWGISYTWIFFFWAIGNIKTLRVEDVRYSPSHSPGLLLDLWIVFPAPLMSLLSLLSIIQFQPNHKTAEIWWQVWAGASK